MSNVEYIGCGWEGFLGDAIITEKKIEVVCETCNWTPDEDAYSILIDSNEPDFYYETTAEDILKDPTVFDIIITRRPELLHLPNAVKVPYGTTLITEEGRKEDSDLVNKKQPSVSYTMTNKFLEEMSGYQLRYQVIDTWETIQSKSSMPVLFYDSAFLPTHFSPLKLEHPDTGKGRDALMEHMFHIAIENSRHDNYFTEKLLDCLLTKTVPIYFGCPNISEYFDTDGMFIIESCSDLHEVLSELTPQKYFDMMDSINKNYELAQEYKNFTERVRTEVQSMVNEKEK